MNVWCLFYVSDETLEWELTGIYATCDLATKAAKEFVEVDDEDEYEWDTKIEKWEVRT